MASLFIVEDKVVIPHTETLLISPFKEIWDRDKSKTREFATEDFCYMEFMASMKASNPYRQYPEDKKHEIISEAVITRSKWVPDELIIEGILKIQMFQKEASTTYSYYMAAKQAVDNMQEFFETVDLNERNGKTGTPIYKPRDLTSALNDTGKVLANLKALEKKVEEELYESAKKRSDKEISPFAEPSSLK